MAALMMIGFLFIPVVASLIPQGPIVYSRFDGTIDPYLDLMIAEHSKEDVFRSLVQFRVSRPVLVRDDPFRAVCSPLSGRLTEATLASSTDVRGLPRPVQPEGTGRDLPLLFDFPNIRMPRRLTRP